MPGRADTRCSRSLRNAHCSRVRNISDDSRFFGNHRRRLPIRKGPFPLRADPGNSILGANLMRTLRQLTLPGALALSLGACADLLGFEQGKPYPPDGAADAGSEMADASVVPPDVRRDATEVTDVRADLTRPDSDWADETGHSEVDATTDDHFIRDGAVEAGDPCVAVPGSKRCGAECISASACCDARDCPSGATCDKGACACPTGQHVCGSSCISNADPNHCGSSCSPCVAPTNGMAS